MTRDGSFEIGKSARLPNEKNDANKLKALEEKADFAAQFEWIHNEIRAVNWNLFVHWMEC